MKSSHQCLSKFTYHQHANIIRILIIITSNTTFPSANESFPAGAPRSSKLAIDQHFISIHRRRQEITSQSDWPRVPSQEATSSDPEKNHSNQIRSVTMAALNHAIMIPGLVLVIIVFWLWIPIWAIVWCCRRASGTRNTDIELQNGHIPHKGFQPPADSDYIPWRQETQFVSAPLKTGKHHFRNAAEKREYEKKHGIVAASTAGDRDERRRKRESEQREKRGADMRRAEKGNAVSVSQSSVGPSSDASLVYPQKAVARESQRQHRADQGRR